MSVRAKLLVIILFVALVPISFLSYTILGQHQATLNATLSELQEGSAKYSAKIVAAHLERPLADLERTVGRSIDWPALNPAEREGALWLAYQQLNSIAAVVLLDGEQVLGSASAAYSGGDAAPRPALTSGEIAQLVAAAPRGPGPAQELHYGEAFALTTGQLVLPLTMPVGLSNGAEWSVVMAVALDTLCAELERERPEGAHILVFDRTGHTLCGERIRVAPALSAQFARGEQRALRYLDERGEEMLGAVVATPAGFGLAITQRVSAAFAPSVRMRVESVLWIVVGVLAATGAGLLLARAINRPLAELSRGAERVAGGDFSVRLGVDGQDELAAVTASFNRMCGEIERRDGEIRAWNAELRARIEAKTAELERVHEALHESRKIGALAALAAGVAHEINNPLTGVIGLTQLMLGRARKEQKATEIELLGSIEREAQRVRQIVQKMAELSETTETRAPAEVRLGATLRSMLQARQPEFLRANVELSVEIDPELLPVQGDAAQLVRVFDAVVDNALKAMRGKSGVLRVTAEQRADGARFQISDTGKGIKPEYLDKVFEPFFTTKEDWHGHGLGLTAAYRVIEAHHGAIRLESQLERGTTVTIDLPTRRQAGAA
jgi:two-component system, NtrC family, sensor kinase